MKQLGKIYGLLPWENLDGVWIDTSDLPFTSLTSLQEDTGGTGKDSPLGLYVRLTLLPYRAILTSKRVRSLNLPLIFLN